MFSYGYPAALVAPNGVRRRIPSNSGLAASSDRPHDLLVGFFIAATDVVGLPGCPSREHHSDRFTMVANVQPVPHVLAISLKRKGLSREGVHDHERN